jgi:Restriction endonuclease
MSISHPNQTDRRGRPAGVETFSRGRRYLLRRIRDEPDPLHAQATALKVEMCEIGLRMIRQLDWRDFETLVDLIFARGGWQRSSVLGKNQTDVDLILTQPTIGETAWVQIKSGTSQAELDHYLGRFRRDGSCHRFFFVCHSATAALSCLPSRGCICGPPSVYRTPRSTPGCSIG